MQPTRTGGRPLAMRGPIPPLKGSFRDNKGTGRGANIPLNAFHGRREGLLGAAKRIKNNQSVDIVAVTFSSRVF